MSGPPAALATLPPLLRTKTVNLAARALGELPVDRVPAPLRRAAAFVPSRRAKLAGKQIAALLDADPQFRDDVAVQVRALATDTLAGIADGAVGEGGDLLDAAAVAFLVRPAGWEDVVSAGSAEATRQAGDTGARSTSHPRADEQRLAAALSSARADLAAVRERLGGQLEKLKKENAQLRRAVGTARSDLRQAEQHAAAATEEAADARRTATVSDRSREAEARRLRKRVSELEAQLAQLARSDRSSRDADATRRRLLLDTVIEAASGLRRELALPATEVLPADTVPAVKPADLDAAQHAGRGLMPDDPDLLRRLLDLPRVHLLVDGYNVTKTAWPTLPLDQQRTRLMSAVAAFVAGKAVETTLIFDGANIQDAPGLRAPGGVRVLFSPPGVIADDLIRQLVAREPQGRPVVVVTSDRQLADSVVAPGVRCLPASALIGAVKR